MEDHVFEECINQLMVNKPYGSSICLGKCFKKTYSLLDSLLVWPYKK